MSGQHRANGGPSWRDQRANFVEPVLPEVSAVWDELETTQPGVPDLYDEHPWTPDYLDAREVRAAAVSRMVDLPQPTPRPYHWTKGQLADWLAMHHPPSEPGFPCRCGAVSCEYQQKVRLVDWST